MTGSALRFLPPCRRSALPSEEIQNLPPLAPLLKFTSHNLWPFNDLQIVKTLGPYVYFLIEDKKC